METWTDINGDGNSRLTHPILDNNDWPLPDANTVKQHCQTTGTPAITWGGPISVFRSDNIASYDITKMSIRNIDASKRLVSGYGAIRDYLHSLGPYVPLSFEAAATASLYALRKPSLY